MTKNAMHQINSENFLMLSKSTSYFNLVFLEIIIKGRYSLKEQQKNFLILVLTSEIYCI